MYKTWEPSKTVCMFALGNYTLMNPTLASLALLIAILYGKLMLLFLMAILCGRHYTFFFMHPAKF